MTEIILNIENLTIALPAGADREIAVDRLNLTLRAGEVTCLVGESGSGKSLAARSIMGLLPPRVHVKDGSIRLGKKDLVSLSTQEMAKIRGASIGMIFQEPMTALNPLHRIGKQIDEVLRLHTKLRRHERESRVVELLEDVHMPEPARISRSFPHQLSGGQRQRAMIAMALALGPKLLIADEPTTALDVTTQAQILKLIHDLQRQKGTAVLFITHDFGVVADIADNVAVLQKGVLVESGAREDVLLRPKHPYTKSLLQAVPRLALPDNPTGELSKPGLVLLMGKDIDKAYGGRGIFGKGRQTQALKKVSFELRRGETLGLLGESGSGKSTLARAVTRLMPIDAGEIILDGVGIEELDRKALRPHRKKIQMVFQDPYASLNPRQKIIDVVSEGLLIHGVNSALARTKSLELLELVGLGPSAADRYPHEFSGGQRQRIGIARALALEPEVLVADEPVSALDVSVQAQVLELLAKVKRRMQLSMLFVTHDLRVALQVCDRIAVMQKGEIVEIGDTRQIFNNPCHPYTRALFDAAPGAAWARDETAIL